MKSTAVRACVLLALIMLAVLPLGSAYAVSQVSVVAKTSSGLVASDPLDSTQSQSQLSKSSFWLFGGDAIGEGAPYAYNENSSGLYIGVRATSNGQYAGLYALHRDTATLVHAVITARSRTVSSGYPNVGLYAQTGGTDVDYIECVAVTSSGGTYWGVALITGTPYGAATYQQLWVDKSANQPLTRSCTIATNGQNYLAVYVDGALVYKNGTSTLGYQQPLQFFLETQTSYAGTSYYGSFKDFYLTSNDSVTVQNVPTGDTAEVTDSSGTILASSTSGADGVATLPVGMYSLPISGNIEVYDSAHDLVATTSPTASIYGGDVFSVTSQPYKGPTPPLAPSGLTASTVSSSQIDLSWTAPPKGGAPITGYMIQRSTDGGAFETVVPNTGSTSTSYLDSGLSAGRTYSYEVSALSSVGSSPLSNTASATTSPPTSSSLTVDSQLTSGTQVEGMYVELAQREAQVGTGYTPAQFTLNNGQTYSLTVENYGNYYFGYWLDTQSSNATRTVATSANLTLTAVYCDGPCPPPPPPPGDSFISVSTVSSTGAQINGYYITLSQNGTQIGSCFSACSFTVANGATYEVAAASFGSETFNHWQNDGSTGLETVAVPTSSATIQLTAVYSP